MRTQIKCFYNLETVACRHVLTGIGNPVCISSVSALREFVIVPAGTKAEIFNDIHTAVLRQHDCTEAS